MIVQEQDDQLILIRQTDHAVLSGFFAREWGNELFQRPEPFESVRLAAGEHEMAGANGNCSRTSTRKRVCRTASCRSPRKNISSFTSGESND